MLSRGGWGNSFHSISFPSEWGGAPVSNGGGLLRQPVGFHSISFPSEWGVDFSDNCPGEDTLEAGFHSISFPSEWGVDYDAERNPEVERLVSIQLVSPASGEF